MNRSAPTQHPLQHRYADLGDVRMHYVEAGPAQGPLVVLLHGFPEFWYSWRHQLPALAGAGLRVVAPDMRGYNLSDKPAGTAAYHTDLLTRDVARLIQALGAERAMVVGHDWGAVVAWLFAMRYPRMVERLAILNVPHPAMLRAGLRQPRQWRKSWYVFFFQLPWLPEWGFRARRYRTIRRLFRSDPVRAGAFSDDDIDRYIEALAQPGALTATINYYRALVRYHPRGLGHDLRVIQAPALVIWGEQDRALEPSLAEPPRHWVPDLRIERLPDASHWVQVDRPEAVNQLLLGFLRPTIAP